MSIEPRNEPQMLRWFRKRGVAPQRFAQARGAVKNKIQAAPVLRTDAWRRSVGQPLLRDNPALGSQRPSRATRAHACSSKGARRANSPLRGYAAAWSPRTSGAAPHPGNPSPPQYRCEAQAPAQGDVQVRRGQRGARISRHSRKPSPRMRAVARPHVWQKFGLAKMGVECARRERLPTMRPIACHPLQREGPRAQGCPARTDARASGAREGKGRQLRRLRGAPAHIAPPVCPRPHGHVLPRMPPIGKAARCGASVAPEARRKRGAAARHTASQAAAAAPPASPAPAPGAPSRTRQHTPGRRWACRTNPRSGNGLSPRHASGPSSEMLPPARL